MTTNSEDIVELATKDIVRMFGSLDEPSFAAMTALAQSKPHKVIIDTIESLGCEIQDFTDLNQDHATSLLITPADGVSLFLQLSFIGPYASLRRCTATNSEPVPTSQVERTENECRIAQVLNDHGFNLLGKPILETPITIRLFYAEPGNTKLYQALFTDCDLLPWDLR